MGSVGETRSVISVDGDIGHIDPEQVESLCNYPEERPVIISAPFPLIEGKPRSVSVNERIFSPITIMNTTTDAVDLWSVEIYDSKPSKESFTLSVMDPFAPGAEYDHASYVSSTKLDDRTLLPGKSLTIWLSCNPQTEGLHYTAVHFSLCNDKIDERIERMGFVMAEINSDHI